MSPDQLSEFELGIREIAVYNRDVERYVTDLLEDTFENCHRNPPDAAEIRQVLSKLLASLVIDSLNGPNTVRLSPQAVKRVESVLFRVLLNYSNRDLAFQAIELLINLANLVSSCCDDSSIKLSAGYEIHESYKISVLSETLDRIRTTFPNHSPAEFSNLARLYVAIVTEGRHYHNFVHCPTVLSKS